MQSSEKDNEAQPKLTIYQSETSTQDSANKTQSEGNPEALSTSTQNDEGHQSPDTVIKVQQVSQQAPKKHSVTDYKILSQLGSGAYGEVFLVEHKESKQKFALKRINKNFMSRVNPSHRTEADAGCRFDQQPPATIFFVASSNFLGRQRIPNFCRARNSSPLRLRIDLLSTCHVPRQELPLLFAKTLQKWGFVHSTNPLQQVFYPRNSVLHQATGGDPFASQRPGSNPQGHQAAKSDA